MRKGEGDDGMRGGGGGGGSEEMPENEGKFEGGMNFFPPLPFRE